MAVVDEERLAVLPFGGGCVASSLGETRRWYDCVRVRVLVLMLRRHQLSAKPKITNHHLEQEICSFTFCIQYYLFGL